MEHRRKKLLDQVRDAIRLKQYSIRTEESQVTWLKRYILFHNKRHPNEMVSPEIAAFQTHLAVDQKVAASAQNRALSALLFLHRDGLNTPLDLPIEAMRAKKPQRVPTVFDQGGNPQRHRASLWHAPINGEATVWWRVKADGMSATARQRPDFALRQIIVRNGTGMEDRVTVLPERGLER